MKFTIGLLRKLGMKAEEISVGDTLDADVMHFITGVTEDEAEGRIVIQGRRGIQEDAIGGMKLYETVLKMDGEPYTYQGLCQKGDIINRSPAAAPLVYVCSPFRETESLSTEFNEKFAMAVTRKLFLEGCLPVAPHLYFPRFLNDSGYEREYGIAAGHKIMGACSRIVVCVIDGYISEGMESDIEYATERLAIQPEYFRYNREAAEEMVRKQETRTEIAEG